MKKSVYLLSMLIFLTGIGNLKAQNYDVGVTDIRDFNENSYKMAKGIAFVPQIWIKNYGDPIGTGLTIPVSLDLDIGTVITYNHVTTTPLNTGDSIGIFMEGTGTPYFYVYPVGTPGSNVNVKAWTDLAGDVDNTNDELIINFKVYNTNRDVGISAISEPMDSIEVDEGDEFSVTFDLRNFDDTALAYLQEIPLKAFLMIPNTSIFYNEQFKKVQITDLNGLASMGNKQFSFTEDYKVPEGIGAGTYDFCITTEFDIDNNFSNNSHCVSVIVNDNIEYDIGISKIINASPPHEGKAGTGIAFVPQIQIKNFGTKAIPKDTEISLYYSVTNDNLLVPEGNPIKLTLTLALAPDSSIQLNMLLGGQGAAYFPPPGSAPDNIEFCARIEYGQDQNHDNDQLCYNFKVYEAQRDVGVTSIVLPKPDQVLNRGSSTRIEYTYRNFSDTLLVRRQRIPFVVTLTNANNFNLNVTLSSTGEGLAPDFSQQIYYDSYPVSSSLPIGPAQLCIASIWGIDNNPDNNEQCVDVTIGYAVSTEKLSNGDLEVMVYPNPANEIANFTYSLTSKELVNISLYDIHGRLINMPVNEIQEPGQHNLRFNTDELNNGLYMYSIQVGNDRVNGKLMIQR